MATRADRDNLGSANPLLKLLEAFVEDASIDVKDAGRLEYLLANGETSLDQEFLEVLSASARRRLGLWEMAKRQLTVAHRPPSPLAGAEEATKPSRKRHAV